MPKTLTIPDDATFSNFRINEELKDGYITKDGDIFIFDDKGIPVHSGYKMNYSVKEQEQAQPTYNIPSIIFGILLLIGGIIICLIFLGMYSSASYYSFLTGKSISEIQSRSCCFSIGGIVVFIIGVALIFNYKK